MRAGGQLAEKAAAHLLWAAAFIDALFVLLLLQMLGPLLQALMELLFPGISMGSSRADPAIVTAVRFGLGLMSYVILLILYWFVTEMGLGGRTIGRACLGLQMLRRDGSKPGVGPVTKRALRKIGSLGMSGTAISKLDKHDRNNGIAWYSPLVADGLSATRNWRIVVESGASAGMSHVLDRLDGYRDRRVIKIGLDPKWSDIVLDQDELVSKQHAIIRLRQTGWQIADYGGGRGSTNRTWLNGKALVPGKWERLTPGDPIRIADVKMKLIK